MQPISSEYRQFVLDHAPKFVRVVATAKESGEAATTDLNSFRNNPFLLYAALWYAAAEGVTICIMPERLIPGRD